MLTLVGGQVECLWDEVLPIEARELPEDLGRLDRVLTDPALLWNALGSTETVFCGLIVESILLVYSSVLLGQRRPRRGRTLKESCR